MPQILHLISQSGLLYFPSPTHPPHQTGKPFNNSQWNYITFDGNRTLPKVLLIEALFYNLGGNYDFYSYPKGGLILPTPVPNAPPQPTPWNTSVLRTVTYNMG